MLERTTTVTTFRHTITATYVGDSESWRVVVYADDVEIGSIGALGSASAARQAGDYLKAGFQTDYRLAVGTTTAMIEVGVEALEVCRAEGEDTPEGALTDADLVRQVFYAMEQAQVGCRLDGSLRQG